MIYKKTSIIILAHKEPKKFKKMFETLLKATHKQETPYEIIIISNAVDLEINRYIQENMELIDLYICSPENLGTSSGFNLGVENSKGHYVCFFNSDYYMMDEWLKSMIDCFEHKPNIGLISCCTNCTGNETERCDSVTSLSNEYMEAECAIAQMFTTKEIWEEVKGFDENLYPISFEDLDFNEKIKEKGYDIFVNGKCFGFHDYYPDKEAGREEIKNKNRKYFKDKWGDKYKWA